MSAVHSRYARAFADVLFEKHLDVNQAVSELRSVAQTVAGSPELKRVWSSPAISKAEKHKLLGAIAVRAGVAEFTRNFLAVLIDHGRIGELGQVLAQLEQEVNQRMGLAEAEIISTRELGADEKRALELQVAQLTGKQGRQVRANYSLDVSLLGGVVVKLGSTIYDGSVRGRLDKIREQLSAGS